MPLPTPSELLHMPSRLAGATAEVTFALARLLAPQGMVGRLEVMAEDPESPLGRIAALGKAFSADRPLGRAIAPGGLLDQTLAEDGPLGRLLADEGPVDRLLAPGGAVERLLATNGPLERLLAPDGPLDRITMPGGLLDKLLSEDGLVERTFEDGGFIDKLVAEGGTADQLVELGYKVQALQPVLVELMEQALPELRASIDVLGETVVPLADLANRIPGRKRSTTT